MDKLSRLKRCTTRCRQAAFTLIELLIAVAIIGALGTIAINSYQGHKERARVAKAVMEIGSIALALNRYQVDNRTYPPNLGVLRLSTLTDPWGRPYQYLPIDVVPPPTTGQIRRDKNLNPLNTDFDLYSMGPDGQTAKQLTASKARDDIVRANNGAFIGVAKDH
jgi:general secretion pathway protein G